MGLTKKYMRKISNGVKKLILPIILISMFSLAFLPSLVLAQADPLSRLETVQSEAGLPDRNLEETIGVIINTIISLLGVILVVLIVYGGFLWMTAGGNDDQVKKAQTIIKNSVIGLIIVLLAYGITRFVLESLLDATA